MRCPHLNSYFEILHYSCSVNLVGGIIFDQVSILSRFLIVIVTFLLSQQAFANEPIIIHQTFLTERLDADGTKGYNKYLAGILKHYEGEVKLDISPIKRSARRFAKDPSSCLFPSNIRALRTATPELKDAELIKSLPVDYVSFNVYVPTGQNVPTRLEDLNGMRLGHASGSVGPNLLKGKNLDVSFLRVTTDEQLVKILVSGRVDAILGFHPDVAITFNRLEQVDLIYSPQLTLFKVPVSIICHPNKKTTSFISYMDQAIISLNKSGKAKKHLGVYSEVIPLEQLLGTGATASF